MHQFRIAFHPLVVTSILEQNSVVYTNSAEHSPTIHKTRLPGRNQQLRRFVQRAIVQQAPMHVGILSDEGRRQLIERVGNPIKQRTERLAAMADGELLVRADLAE